MTGFLHRAWTGFRSEDGSASMEFVLVIPLMMAVFMASFESGLLMVRAIMLEQAVDMTMRELRLGHYPLVTHDTLKTEICSRTVIFPNCVDQIMVEMQRVSTTTWALPDHPVTCVDREEEIQPVTALQIGQQNDMMVVRVCITQDAMFPGTGIALDMELDAQGGYGLVTTTAFVTEPS
jgi:hypothetical protein